MSYIPPFMHQGRRRVHWTALAIAWIAVVVTVILVLRLTSGT